MHVVTDDERREVAERLRKLVTDDSVYADVDAVCVLYAIGLYYKDVDRIYFSGIDVARLADLIEPSIPADPGEAGLACVDAFTREHTEKPVDRGTPQKVAEEMFGKMRHSTKEEADAYDAMLKSKSVELHPVDRDALLALADEMETADPEDLDVAIDYVTECASRIREALGVEHG